MRSESVWRDVAVKDNVRELQVCPLCGKPYIEPPALSRTDNETLICPDCGTRQALADLGVDMEDQEKILAIIHGLSLS